MKLLEIANATARHGQQILFQNVSFGIQPGEFISLIGPNGAGKSSLLKAMVGQLPLAEGSIRLNSKRGNTGEPACRIGYMPQKLNINPLMPLSVEAFLDLSIHAHLKNDVIKETGIHNLTQLSMHTLSGGETQRVLLARALLNKPTLLILDEPTQGVDADGEQQFFSLLEHLHQHHGLAIFMVSHNLHFVHKASQTVLCLNKQLCCTGAPAQIQQDDRYRALFQAGQTDFQDNLRPYAHHHAQNIIESQDTLISPRCSITHEDAKP